MRPFRLVSMLACIWLAGLAILGTAEGRGLDLTIRLNGDSFVVGETIDLDLTLVNTGPAPVQIPDIGVQGIGHPVYTLTGPDYPGGTKFIQIPLHSHERPASARPPGRRAPPPRLRAIAPGQRLKTAFSVSRTITVDQPGDYTLAARLAHGNVDVAAAPVAFRILANTYLGASLALDGPANDRGFRIVWLGEGGDGRRIGEVLVVEHRPNWARSSAPACDRCANCQKTQLTPSRPGATTRAATRCSTGTAGGRARR